MPIRYYIVPLFLVATSCAARTPAEAEPDPATGEATLDEQTGPWPMSPRDPCTVKVPAHFHGFTILVPVPCNRFWIDKGDPPPDPTSARVITAVPMERVRRVIDPRVRGLR
jgi:hypothetical protein